MFSRLLFGLAVLGATGAPLAAQNVKAGIEAWQRADYAGAITIWRPLAEKGDADAAFNLGQAYRLGRGVPTNLGAAQTWFERAAEKGHVDAQATLGLLLFQNGNQAAGLKWLKAAAEQGEARALLVYGTALFNGDNVTQDRSSATPTSAAPRRRAWRRPRRRWPSLTGCSRSRTARRALRLPWRRRKRRRRPPRRRPGRSRSQLRSHLRSQNRSLPPLPRRFHPRQPAATGESSSALSRKRGRPKLYSSGSPGTAR